MTHAPAARLLSPLGPLWSRQDAGRDEMGAQKLAGRRTSASDRQVRATPPRRGYSRQAVLRRREGLCRAALPWVPGRRELSSWLWLRQRVRTPHPRKGAGSPGRWARPQATQHMAMAGAAGRPTPPAAATELATPPVPIVFRKPAGLLATVSPCHRHPSPSCPHHWAAATATRRASPGRSVRERSVTSAVA